MDFLAELAELAERHYTCIPRALPCCDGWALSSVQTFQATATIGTDTTAPITPARTVPEATLRATASGCRLTARLITIG